MRALVLSGGGTHGAYQAGVLKHLMGDQKRYYDILAGVSVGAVNASGLVQYKKGEEKEAAESLEKLWLSIDNSSVWKHHFPPYISALWKRGLYSTKPLRRLLEKNFDYKKALLSGKILRIPAVSLSTGQWGVWTEKDEDILDGVMASCTFPGMFEAQEARGQFWVDGGVRTVTPIKEVIDAGADTIDIVITFKPGIGKSNKSFKTVEVLLRTLDILMDELISNDLKICELKNHIEGYRKISVNLYSPSVGLKGMSLDFNPENIRRELELGYRDAVSKG